MTSMQSQQCKMDLHALFDGFDLLREEQREPAIESFRKKWAARVDNHFLNESDFTPYEWKNLTQIISEPEKWQNTVDVSVIVPAYNAEKQLRQCLDSILSCRGIRLELIAVDDGSTDGTAAILHEYKDKDPRVQVLTQKNGGAGAARNCGMKIARGEYITFLDADDFFEPDMLSSAYIASINKNSDITVWRSDTYYDSTQNFVPRTDTIRENLLPEQDPFAGTDVKQDIFRLFVGWTWDKLFRTSFVREKELTFQEQRTTNDLLFVFSAIVLAERITTMDQVLAHHRISAVDESLSHTREKSWDCFYHALKALKEQLIACDLYKRFEQDYVNYCLNFSLWNVDTLKGNAYLQCYSKLKNEWFREFGIADKPESFFYNNAEYQNYLEILRLDPLSYRLHKANVPVITNDEEVNLYLTEEIIHLRNENTRMANEIADLKSANALLAKEKNDLSSTNTQLASKYQVLNQYIEEIKDSTSWKLGSSLTYIPGIIKRYVKGFYK